MSQKKQQQKSQPNTAAQDIGINIVESRRRVEELRINILNSTGRNMEAPVLIIQKWLKKDDEKQVKK